MIKNKFRQFWQLLSVREKILSTIIIVIIIPIILIRFMVLPLINFSNNITDSKQTFKQRVINFNNKLSQFEELKRLNSTINFDFDNVSTEIFNLSGIDEIPDIRENSVTEFGKSYIIRFNSLRTDQIFRLIYNFEHNTPPIIIEKIETSESIQTAKQASLSMIIKTE